MATRSVSSQLNLWSHSIACLKTRDRESRRLTANLHKYKLKVSSSSKTGAPTSPLYLRALADLLVMLYPLSPAFACELWEGYRVALSLAPPLLEASLRRHAAWPYDLQKDLFEQPFPEAALVDVNAKGKLSSSTFSST
ncbi:unnamed protein product [Dibothriocephalus latus]|uniref:Uncharacterized protein n=1 Tax=Dibothriocephalus latus TaxID=60516 RepID=A0A3P6T5W3_DIBLA|nr:unnamed protein product [Dibothriocephalus latus]